MTASAWIALGSLAVVVCAHAVFAAFMMGKLSQRVATVERDLEDRAALNNTVIAFKATTETRLDHLETQNNKAIQILEGLQRTVANIAMDRIGLSGELK